jgi:hypothetical protein
MSPARLTKPPRFHKCFLQEGARSSMSQWWIVLRNIRFLFFPVSKRNNLYASPLGNSASKFFESKYIYHPQGSIQAGHPSQKHTPYLQGVPRIPCEEVPRDRGHVSLLRRVVLAPEVLPGLVLEQPVNRFGVHPDRLRQALRRPTLNSENVLL